MPRLRPIPSDEATNETPRSENRLRALIYAQQGVRIFPCNLEKRPLVKDWFNAASADENQISEWWNQNPEALIAIPMKLIDCLTVDCDRHSPDEDGVALFNKMIADNAPLPEHPTIKTANNGEHHIFRQPKEKIGNRVIALGLETRGFKLENDGGYIIAPATMLPDGRGWRIAAGSPSFLKSLKANTIPQPPRWLVNICRPPTIERVHHSAGRCSKDDTGWLRALVRTVANAPHGERNRLLFWAACRAGEGVRDGKTSEDFAISVLIEAAAHAGLPRSEARPTIYSALRTAGART